MKGYAFFCRSILIFFASLSLFGCAVKPPVTGIKYDSDVYVRTSDAIVVRQMESVPRTMYVQIDDRVHNPVLMQTLRNVMVSSLEGRGYQIVSSDKQAQYAVQAKVLFAGIGSVNGIDDVFLQGYGGRISPAGRITLGVPNYDDIAVPSWRNEAMIVDVQVFERDKRHQWQQYSTRLAATITYTPYNRPFSRVQNRLCDGVGQTIAAMF